MGIKEIKSLMKAWRQEMNNSESPVKEMKFRCCGMKAVPSEGQTGNFAFEPQKTEGKIDLKKPEGMSPEELTNIIQDFCQGDQDLAKYFIHRIADLLLWSSYNTHYRLYASSVCLFYDMDDHSN